MKKQKTAWVDDGRVIASMNVEGIPNVWYRPRGRRRFDEFGQVANKPEPLALTKAERRAIFFGVGAAHAAALIWALLFLAVLLLLFLAWSK